MKRSRGRKANESAWKRWIPTRLRLDSWRRGAIAVGIVAATVVVLSGSQAVREYVESDSRYYLGGFSLQVDQLPAWVTPEIESEIATIEFGEEPLSLFDPGVLAAVREKVEASPWVEEASDLGLIYPTPQRPGAIEARIRFRTPIALVQVDRDAYLVDPEGRRLGKGYDPADPAVRDWFGLPFITGVPAGAPVPAAGEKWQSRSVLEGLRVAREIWNAGIAKEFPGRPIERVDVANVRGGGLSDVVLVSEGRRLVWGRSDISDDARVQNVDRKLKNLREAFRDTRLDGSDVLLYTDKLVSSEPKRPSGSIR